MLNREQRELVQVLAGFPVLAGCRTDDLAALVRTGRATSLPAHWTFVHEQTPADAVYVLLDGQAQVRVGGVERAVLEPGAVIGEMALLSRRLRTASVVAVSRVEVLRLEYADLVALMIARPRLGAALSAAFEEHRAADLRAAEPRAGASSGGT